MNTVRIAIAAALACILMVNVSLADQKKGVAGGKGTTSGDSGGKVKVYDFSNDTRTVKGSTGPTQPPKPAGSKK